MTFQGILLFLLFRDTFRIKSVLKNDKNLWVTQNRHVHRGASNDLEYGREPLVVVVVWDGSNPWELTHYQSERCSHEGRRFVWSAPHTLDSPPFIFLYLCASSKVTFRCNTSICDGIIVIIIFIFKMHNPFINVTQVLTARKRTKNGVVKAPTELWLVWIITIRAIIAIIIVA